MDNIAISSGYFNYVTISILFRLCSKTSTKLFMCVYIYDIVYLSILNNFSNFNYKLILNERDHLSFNISRQVLCLIA